MSAPDTNFGEFIKQLGWFQMLFLMIAALMPYFGGGLFMFCLMADYRSWLNGK